VDGASKLDNYLTSQRPLFEALTQLLHPFMEIAIHRPETGELVEIFHNLTKRKAGEITPLRELGGEFFMRRNGDRHPLKCATVPVTDDEGEQIAIVALLIDTSLFQETLHMVQSFLSLPGANGGETPQIVTEDCRAKIAQVIDDFLRRNNLSLAHLSRCEKQQAVQTLHEKGVFSFKNSVPEVAQQLRLSRATVYNYLKEI